MRSQLAPGIELVRRHAVLFVVLCLGAILQLAVAIAYRPAIMWADSWTYVRLAFEGHPVLADPARPSGYPLILDGLFVPGRELATVTTIQHLAVLGVAIVLYVLLLRLGAPRLLAAGAAALVVLDEFTAILAQSLMSETFFGTALVLSAFLIIGRDRGPVALAASGALLGVAVTIRTMALFAIPVWIAYLLCRHWGTRALVVGLAALALPVAGYVGWFHHETGVWRTSDGDGWFLYGRVAPFADCGKADVPASTRPLCDDSSLGPGDRASDDYIWDPDSPARRIWPGGMFAPDLAMRHQINADLRGFAIAVIRAQPGDYAAKVGGDFLDFFTQAHASRPPADPTAGFKPTEIQYQRDVHNLYFPGVKLHADPGGALAAYLDHARTPPWLLGLLLALGLAAPAASLVSRGRLRLAHAPESLFLAGMALLPLLGSVAVSEFQSRFVPPLAPFMLAAGCVALADLGHAVADRGGSRSVAAPAGA